MKKALFMFVVVLACLLDVTSVFAEEKVEIEKITGFGSFVFKGEPGNYTELCCEQYGSNKKQSFAINSKTRYKVFHVRKYKDHVALEKNPGSYESYQGLKVHFSAWISPNKECVKILIVHLSEEEKGSKIRQISGKGSFVLQGSIKEYTGLCFDDMKVVTQQCFSVNASTRFKVEQTNQYNGRLLRETKPRPYRVFQNRELQFFGWATNDNKLLLTLVVD